MSKLKLLLLGGIFTLVGIFNFSSSQFLTPSTCRIGAQCSIANFNSYRFDGDGYYKIVVMVQDGNSVRYLGASKGNCKCDGSFSCFLPNHGDLSTFRAYASSEGYNPDNVIGYAINTNTCAISNVYYSSDKMPITALTPAIDSLKGTVYQIIPYVVYIGIGTLLAVLGFYAVRWLVNRIVKKINSVFRSKRG